MTSHSADQSDQPASWKGKGLRIGAVVVIAGSLLLLFFTVNPILPKPALAPHKAAGKALGDLAGKLLAGGGRLVVIARETEQFKVPAAEAQFEAFSKTLAAQGIKITTTRVVKSDPLRAVSVPPGDFFEIIRKLTEKDVIVSFMGPPNLSVDQIGKLSEAKPSIIAVCSGFLPMQMDLRRLFEEKLLHTVLVSRLDTPASTPPTFENTFKLVNSANLNELPARSTL